MANVTREIARINEAERKQRHSGLDSSWHNDYKDTAWIFAGNLSYKLSEGDIIAVFSQYGEIEDIHLVRDDETGQSKGFCFLKYEDWKSTVLAVDNLNGTELLNRVLRVDHSRYERPKLKKEKEKELSIEEKAKMQQPGHAYRGDKKIQLEGNYSLDVGQNVFDTSAQNSKELSETNHHIKSLKELKKRKKKRKNSDKVQSKEKKKKKKGKKAKRARPDGYA